MLFRSQTLEGIARGEITVAFRRWKKPSVKAGGRARTAAGAVRIGEVSACDPSRLTEADARASGFSTLAALREMLGSEDGKPVYRIALLGIEPDERVARREAVDFSDAEWSELRQRFAKWERSAPGYFPAILRTIAERPGVLAATLAKSLGVEKLRFKQDVRKLKERGLTESLEIGYRLSPRGRVVLQRLGELL